MYGYSEKDVPRRPAAFTLVELLVVIGVIALLISILMPALSKATESARAIKCASNLKNIGVALAAYVQDNGGYYPLKSPYLYNNNSAGGGGATVFSWVGQAGSTSGAWSNLTAADRPLNKYLGTFSQNSPCPIADCPSDDIFGPQSLYSLWGSSYGANTGGLLDPRYANASSPVPPSNDYTINASQVIQPTRLIVMAEHYANNYVWEAPGSYTSNIFYEHYSKINSQHGQWNVLFADYHVAAPIVAIYNGIHDSNGDAADANINLCTNCEGTDYSWIND